MIRNLLVRSSTSNSSSPLQGLAWMTRCSFSSKVSSLKENCCKNRRKRWVFFLSETLFWSVLKS